MASPSRTCLNFGDYIEICVVKRLVHYDVKNEATKEEDGCYDENEKPMTKHFFLMVFRQHFAVGIVYRFIKRRATICNG